MDRIMKHGLANEIVFHPEFGIDDLVLAKYIYFERRMGGETQTYSKLSNYSELPFQYQFKSNHTDIQIPVFSMDINKAKIFIDNPDKMIMNKYIHDKTISMCIHPAVIETKKLDHFISSVQFETNLRAIPTACSRTLIV